MHTVVVLLYVLFQLSIVGKCTATSNFDVLDMASISQNGLDPVRYIQWRKRHERKRRIRKLQTYFSFGFSSKTLNWRCCLLKVLSKIPATSMHLFSSSSRLKKMWEILLCLLSARNTVLVDKTIKHFGMRFALKIESFFVDFKTL